MSVNDPIVRATFGLPEIVDPRTQSARDETARLQKQHEDFTAGIEKRRQTRALGGSFQDMASGGMGGYVQRTLGGGSGNSTLGG